MGDRVRSDGIVKKKSSSGCLIIKKKGQGSNGVAVGVGSSKEKKRPRMVLSNSGSSDEESEAMRRKTGERMHNGGVGFRRSLGDDRGLERNGELERDKRSMNRFKFDRYNEFGGREFSNENRNADGKLKMVRRISGDSRDFGDTESLRNPMVQKRKYSHMDGLNSMGTGGSKGVRSGDCMSKIELDEAEAELPISLLSLKYQEMPDKPIRLQGKNGVLKVMVNSMKKKKTNDPCNNDDRGHIENRKGPRFEGFVKKDLNLRPPLYSESKRMEKRMSTDIREESISMTRQKLFGKSSMDEDLDLDGTDTLLKLAPPSLHASSSSKVKKEERFSTENCISVKKKGNHKSSIESITPVNGEEGKKNSTGSSTQAKGKEGKIKVGGSTEKQKLRETIREMLLEAGWTIDYRPRRNRDYLDSVYISPSGTAYWSIIKAYDALQKQFNGQKNRSKSAVLPSSFAPLSEDLISKLTRQTRKKIGEKMKKRRDDGISRNTKKAIMKDSVDAMDTDQPEETPYSRLRKNLKLTKDNMQKLHHGSGDESSDDTCKQTTKVDRVEESLDAAKNRMVQGIKSRVIGRCTLRVRDSNKTPNSESDGYVPYIGKRTVVAWLVDSGVVQSGEKVQYMNRKQTRVKLEGWITKEGIHCGCCSKTLTVAKFELHAGSKLRRPFQNIFLESGVSLLQCQIDAWNRQEKSERQDFYTVNVDGEDPDDDACGTCGDGGDLICCDSCPSTFHQSCLEIKMLPEGDWHCPNCVCKFCGTASQNDAGDNLSGDELTICSLCERKYHKSCSTDSGAPPVDNNSAATYFCGQKCLELYENVHNILGVKHDLEAGFSWSLIQRTDMDSDVATGGFAQSVECNSKLAVALSVMNECFLPITDRRSGINIIHNAFYNCGANFQRLNYRGFFTVVLERGDEIIAVASIRIHGTQLAEMPFIGTRHIYRRQGMCRRLLSAIELVLSSFKVEKLIIPAIAEHMHTWTAVFGFNPLEEDLKKEIKSLNMLVFPGTDMLQKQLMETSTDVAKAVGLTVGHRQAPTALARKFSSASSAEDVDEGKDAKVLLSKKLDQSDAESGSSDSATCPPNITSSPDHTSLDSSSKSGNIFPLAETTSDQTKHLAESTSGTTCSSSLSALKTDVIDIKKTVDPLNKDHNQSLVGTEAGDLPAGIVNSSGKDMYAVDKNIEDPHSRILADMGGKNCVHSTVAEEVDIQSTPYEVTMNDHDMIDSAFDNIRTGKSTDGNHSVSHMEDAGKHSSGSFSSDLNNPGIGVKDDDAVLVSNSEVPTDAEVAFLEGHMDTSSVYELGNRDGNYVDAVAEDRDALTLADMGGRNGVHPTVASDEVDIQSTPCMNDHDMTDFTFANIQTGNPTDGNGSVFDLEDAGKYSSESFSSDLNMPGVGGKDDLILVFNSEVNTSGVGVNNDLVLVSNSELATNAEVACVEGQMATSSVYEVSNRDDNEVDAVSRNIKDPDSQTLADMGGKNGVHSTVASDEFDVQSTTTPYEVTMHDNDTTDSAAEVVCVEGEVEVGNRDGHDVEAISFELAPASADLNASGGINEGVAFPPSACGETNNSEFCVEMSEMKSEQQEASGLGCKVDALTTSNVSSECESNFKIPSAQAVPDSINVGEAHKKQDTIQEPQNSIRYDSVSTQDIPGDSRALSSEVPGSIDTTVQSNGNSNEVAPTGYTT